MKQKDSHEELLRKYEAVCGRLDEAEETLRAISNHEVDALVVNGPDGDQIFTLKGAERPYRLLVETMREGALSINRGGTILYCNSQVAELLQIQLNKLVGASFPDFLVSRHHRQRFDAMLEACGKGTGCREEFLLKTARGQKVPVLLSTRSLKLPELDTLCIVVTDLTEQKTTQQALEEARKRVEEKVEERTVQLSQANARLAAEITERKRIEGALEKSNNQLEFVLTNSLDAAYQRNLTTDRYEYVSPVIEQLIGFTAEEMINLKTSDMLALVHPDDLPKVKLEKIKPSSGSDRETGTVEYRFRTKSGKYQWLSDRFSLLYDSEGRPAYRVGVVRDIARRKKDEEELARSREELELRVRERTIEVQRALEAAAKERQRLYDVLETLPVLICLLTSDYHVAFANRAFRQRFGEANGRHCYDYVFGQKGPCEFCESFNVLKTGVPYHWECNTPDGHVIDAYDFPFTDIDGSPLVLEMDIDITERKRAEKALLAANAYDRSLIEASVDPLVTINPKGRISDVNAATEHVTGYPREKLIGTDFSDYFTDPEKAKAGYQRVFNEGTVRDYELEILHKDGPVTPVLYNASVFRDELGKVMGVIAAARNISVRKQLEEQLRQAQKLEAIGTLAGGIAHDFNNILAAILGFTEMVIEDVADQPDIYDKMEKVLKAALRGRDLGRQILAFSRKTEGERKRITLTSLVKETQALLRASLPSTIQMALAITVDDDYVHGDPTQLQQVLMNLGTNAADAMREEGGKLTIELSSATFPQDILLPDPELKPGTYVRLTVQDTGQGMTEEVRQRVFEPFFTTKGQGKGTGMGLAVVYGIVKSHGGAVTVKSEVGQGSTFEVFLPRAQRPEPEIEETTTTLLPTGTERILFVDDEEMILETAQRMLTSLGYHVTVAQNGSDGWNLFLQDPSCFDLVITDQTMPDVTGITLAQKMLKVRKGMPIILCTGYSEMVSAEKAREVGISAFAMKPLVRKEFAQTVRGVLDAKSE